MILIDDGPEADWRLRAMATPTRTEQILADLRLATAPLIEDTRNLERLADWRQRWRAVHGHAPDILAHAEQREHGLDWPLAGASRGRWPSPRALVSTAERRCRAR